ncbi:MAG: ribosome-binding factor A [Holosporales bacterium]|jgi:ribosome-binding factor A|nr:ribosome-binding factor A [Holosporales bacterium]
MPNLKLFTPEKRKTVSQRSDKIAAKIKECLSHELTRGNFPILPGHEAESNPPAIITITYVDLSANLRNALIYFMPLGGIKKEESAMFFKLQSYYFKNVIAKKIKLKFIPNIIFRIDDSFDYLQKIESLISKI